MPRRRASNRPGPPWPTLSVEDDLYVIDTRDARIWIGRATGPAAHITARTAQAMLTALQQEGAPDVRRHPNAKGDNDDNLRSA